MKLTTHPYVIAEIGINHNGDFDMAREMVKIAAECGVDAVKFQKRNPDVVVPEHQKPLVRETPWGSMTYLDYKKKIEFNIDQMADLRQQAHSLGLDFSASAWDAESFEEMDSIGVDFHKIASAMTTNTTFVKLVSKADKDIIASTGMCNWKEIDNLVSILGDSNQRKILLHTVSTYPAEEKYLNLNMINTLAERYGIEVGYSGHEASVSPSIVAGALGAKVIERHFTLDRSMWGTDQAASLEPDAMRRLCGSLRKIPIITGDGIKSPVPGEETVASKLRYW